MVTRAETDKNGAFTECTCLLLVNIVHEQVEILDPGVVLNTVQLLEEQINGLLRMMDRTPVQGLATLPSSSQNVNTLNELSICSSTVCRFSVFAGYPSLR
jgi:hypothetical protein